MERIFFHFICTTEKFHNQRAKFTLTQLFSSADWATAAYSKAARAFGFCCLSINQSGFLKFLDKNSSYSSKAASTGISLEQVQRVLSTRPEKDFP